MMLQLFVAAAIVHLSVGAGGGDPSKGSLFRVLCFMGCLPCPYPLWAVEVLCPATRDPVLIAMSTRPAMV